MVRSLRIDRCGCTLSPGPEGKNEIPVQTNGRRRGVIMDIHLLAMKVAQTLRQDGLRLTFRKALTSFQHNTARNEFDLKYGTATGGTTPLWKCQITSPNRCFGVRYQATDEQELVDAVNSLRESLETFSFIDLGCGKGRTLVVAANLGFGRVIGVEFARELVEIAKENLARKSIANGDVVHTDAALYPFPKGDLVVYLYNPFSKEVMQKVIVRLRESGARNLYVIYNNPKCAEVFDSSGFLSRFGCPPQRPNIQIWKGACNQD